MQNVMDKAIESLARQVLQKDPKARFKVLPRTRVKFASRFPFASQHVADISVELSDKEKYPDIQKLALMFNPLTGKGFSMPYQEI